MLAESLYSGVPRYPDIEQMFRLEAYTLSNRGRSLRIVIIAKTTGWKPVPIHIIAESLTFRLYFTYIYPTFSLGIAFLNG